MVIVDIEREFAQIRNGLEDGTIECNEDWSIIGPDSLPKSLILNKTIAGMKVKMTNSTVTAPSVQETNKNRRSRGKPEETKTNNNNSQQNKKFITVRDVVFLLYPTTDPNIVERFFRTTLDVATFSDLRENFTSATQGANEMTIHHLSAADYHIGRYPVSYEMFLSMAQSYHVPIMSFRASLYDIMASLFPRVPIPLLKRYVMVRIPHEEFDWIGRFFRHYSSRGTLTWREYQESYLKRKKLYWEIVPGIVLHEEMFAKIASSNGGGSGPGGKSIHMVELLKTIYMNVSNKLLQVMVVECVAQPCTTHSPMFPSLMTRVGVGQYTCEGANQISESDDDITETSLPPVKPTSPPDSSHSSRFVNRKDRGRRVTTENGAVKPVSRREKQPATAVQKQSESSDPRTTPPTRAHLHRGSKGAGDSTTKTASKKQANPFEAPVIRRRSIVEKDNTNGGVVAQTPSKPKSKASATGNDLKIPPLESKPKIEKDNPLEPKKPKAVPLEKVERKSISAINNNNTGAGEARPLSKRAKSKMPDHLHATENKNELSVLSNSTISEPENALPYVRVGKRLLQVPPLSPNLIGNGLTNKVDPGDSPLCGVNPYNHLRLVIPATYLGADVEPEPVEVEAPKPSKPNKPEMSPSPRTEQLHVPKELMVVAELYMEKSPRLFVGRRSPMKENPVEYEIQYH
eukprot:PhF_6_TR36030/c0_g1_i1/m.52231